MRFFTLWLGLLAAAPAWALPLPPTPYLQCEAAIASAARLPARAPRNLVASIARVESGRLDPTTSKIRPWPWTINVEGVGYFFDSKEAVIAAVQAWQAKGKRSIDVGCMQVNLLHHPNAFATLDDAFDPNINANYAVRFLLALYAQTRDWPLATAYYHSTTPELGEQYQQLVFGRVLTPMGAPSLHPPAPADNSFAAIPPISVLYRALAPAPAPRTFGGMQLFTPSLQFTPQAPIAGLDVGTAFGHGR